MLEIVRTKWVSNITSKGISEKMNFEIGHVRYIKLSMAPRLSGKLLYLVLFSFYPSLLLELKETKLKRITILASERRAMNGHNLHEKIVNDHD